MTYELVCNNCQTRYPSDSGYRLECCPDGLLIAEYPRQLAIDEQASGLWKFRSWLPVESQGGIAASSVCFPAPELGSAIGLDDLWVSFNGYWPERGGACPTGSFKDLEVAPTLQRLLECGAPGLVVATAGNTGRSFAHFGGMIGYPVVVVVAEQHLSRIWRPGLPQAESTVVIALRNADYGDATNVVGQATPRIGWQREGGVRNVARRDGIGTLLLEAVSVMGAMPDHYVQAVSGGPGPIGVGEMSRRLVDDGRFGTTMPRVHLVQNIEHRPIVQAWRHGRNQLEPQDFPAGPVEVYSDVLVNRAPAYGIRGGLRELLENTNGQAHAVSGAAAGEAAELARQTLGIDIMAPAAVALAGLREAAANGEIGRSDRVLLAITGGGVERLAADVELHQPHYVVRLDIDEAADHLVALYEMAKDSTPASAAAALAG